VGGFYKLVQVWATTDFVIKKLRLEKLMKPFLTAIIMSPLFPFILMLGGFIWIWWFSHPPEQQPSRRAKMISSVMIISGLLLIVGGICVYHLYDKNIVAPIESVTTTPNTPNPPSPPPVPQKRELSKEEMMIVDRFFQQYIEIHKDVSLEIGKGNLSPIEDWINDKLKEQGYSFRIGIAPKPKTPTAIIMKNSKDVQITVGKITGFEQVLDISKSEDIKIKAGTIIGPKNH
jgi:hypothetical protein